MAELNSKEEVNSQNNESKNDSSDPEAGPTATDAKGAAAAEDLSDLNDHVEDSGAACDSDKGASEGSQEKHPAETSTDEQVGAQHERQDVQTQPPEASSMEQGAAADEQQAETEQEITHSESSAAPDAHHSETQQLTEVVTVAAEPESADQPLGEAAAVGKEPAAPPAQPSTDHASSKRNSTTDKAATPSKAADTGKMSPATSTPTPEPTKPTPLQGSPAAEANQDDHHHDKVHTSNKALKETAAERLTTPTAMRMLKQLEQTQGGKDTWHIATGVEFKSKKLSADEMSAMVDRLCIPKHEADNLPPKPHAVKLVFEGNKEVLVPVKETSKDDNISYMSNLYTRCQETRAKTMQTLQEKWLQPLIKPKTSTK